jgi:hypothetical protein
LAAPPIITLGEDPRGGLLLCGSALSVLPFFGIWMLPLGLML